MPRRKNRHESVKITITGSPKLLKYLVDLVEEEGYGNTAASVACTLVWRGVEDLVRAGILDRRRGRADDNSREELR